jgi:hypothetical protein
LPMDPAFLPLDEAKLQAAYERHMTRLTAHDGACPIKDWRQLWQETLRRGDRVPDAVTTEVQTLTMGGARLVGLAGEVMVEIGLKIKDRAPQPLMVCGYANSVVGYIPTAAALPEGGYETNSFLWEKYPAPYAPEAEQVLIDAVLGTL